MPLPQKEGMVSEEKKVRLVVLKIGDKDYRHVVSGTEDGISERKAEKVTSGMLRHMDDHFYIDEEEVTDAGA